jgi:uncharacterized protein
MVNMKKYYLGHVSSAAIFMCYIWLIEPQWIEVTTHQVSAPVKNAMTIVQISDLHTSGLGFVERKVIEMVKELEPDIIVFTGDISSPTGTAEDYKKVLTKFKAKKGSYFVHGNWEHWARTEDFKKVLEDSGIILLNNSSVLIDKSVSLIGFDDLQGVPDAKLALKDVSENSYKIALFHSPAYFDSIHERINLGLSGHSHGGQIRLPFLPALWVPEGTGRYVEGWFEKAKSRMYVSRGIGNSILPFRLLSRPEIAVFILE